MRCEAACGRLLPVLLCSKYLKHKLPTGILLAATVLARLWRACDVVGELCACLRRLGVWSAVDVHVLDGGVAIVPRHEHDARVVQRGRCAPRALLLPLP